MRALAASLVAAALAAIPAGQTLGQVQGSGERAAQAKLPQGRSQLWPILRTTQIVEDDARGIFKAAHPPAVRALIGKRLTLPGFIMPLDAQTHGTQFLLSKYTPVCAFCPPGEPNEVVEVRTTRAIAFSPKLVNVTGVFGVENNGENGLFFLLTSAVVR